MSPWLWQYTLKLLHCPPAPVPLVTHVQLTVAAILWLQLSLSLCFSTSICRHVPLNLSVHINDSRSLSFNNFPVSLFLFLSLALISDSLFISLSPCLYVPLLCVTLYICLLKFIYLCFLVYSSVCLSVCFSICPFDLCLTFPLFLFYVSLCLSVSLSLYTYVSWSLHLTVYLSLSFSAICHYVSVSLSSYAFVLSSLHITVSLTLCMSIFMSVCLSVHLTLYFTVSVYTFLDYLYVSLFLSASCSLSLSTSVSSYLRLSTYLYIFFIQITLYTGVGFLHWNLLIPFIWTKFVCSFKK